jgi:NADPH2:quinone reductase
MDLLQRPDLIREALDDLLQRAARGDLRVVVGGTYPLTDVARAHEDIQSRRTSGKLLLDPSS